MKTAEQRLSALRRPLEGKRITVVGGDGIEIDNIQRMAGRAVNVAIDNAFDLMRETEPSDHDAIIACTNFSGFSNDAEDFLQWIDTAGENVPVVAHFGTDESLEPAFRERIASDPKWIGPIISDGNLLTNLASLFEQIAERL